MHEEIAIRHQGNFHEIDDDDRHQHFFRAMRGKVARMKTLCGYHLTNGISFGGGWSVRAPAWNGYPCIIATAAKTTIVVDTTPYLSVDKVSNFAQKRLPAFPAFMPEYTKGTKVIGAMLCQRTDPDGKAIKMARKSNIHLYQATTPKTLKEIKTPSDLTP